MNQTNALPKTNKKDAKAQPKDVQLRQNIKKPRILMGVVLKSSDLSKTRPKKNDQQSYDYANRDINEACSSRHPNLSMVRLGDHNRKRDSPETKRA